MTDLLDNFESHSNSLRKIVQVNVESTSLSEVWRVFKLLAHTKLLEPDEVQSPQGSCILAVESKLIFAFLNNWFGGATNAQERIESRDFTAIEIMVVKKVVGLLLGDLQDAWFPVFPIEGEYIRTEVNPQFLAVVAPSDVVVLTSFEIELDGLRGSVQLVIPYSAIEPIRQHLSRGIGSDSEGEDRTWRELITESLYDVAATSYVNLGVSNVTVRELIELSVGDVITLDRGKNDNLNLFIEDARKFEVRPVERSGYLAAEIVNEVEIRLPPDMRQIAEPR